MEPVTLKKPCLFHADFNHDFKHDFNHDFLHSGTWVADFNHDFKHDFSHENRHSGTGYIEIAVFVPCRFQSRFQSRFKSRFSAQWNAPFRRVIWLLTRCFKLLSFFLHLLHVNESNSSVVPIFELRFYWYSFYFSAEFRNSHFLFVVRKWVRFLAKWVTNHNLSHLQVTYENVFEHHSFISPYKYRMYSISLR